MNGPLSNFELQCFPHSTPITTTSTYSPTTHPPFGYSVCPPPRPISTKTKNTSLLSRREFQLGARSRPRGPAQRTELDKGTQREYDDIALSGLYGVHGQVTGERYGKTDLVQEEYIQVGGPESLERVLYCRWSFGVLWSENS